MQIRILLSLWCGSWFGFHWNADPASQNDADQCGLASATFVFWQCGSRSRGKEIDQSLQTNLISTFQKGFWTSKGCFLTYSITFVKYNLSLDLGSGMEIPGSRINIPDPQNLKQTMWYSYLHLDGDLLLYLDLLYHGGAADVEHAARVDPHLQLDLLIAPLRGRLHLACAHRRVMTAPGIQNPVYGSGIQQWQKIFQAFFVVTNIKL